MKEGHSLSPLFCFSLATLCGKTTAYAAFMSALCWRA